ncbi:MAG: hypothetical protein OEW42_05170 [Acidimicrobiia bacterium]|nr:hypothetical protein [Acidimicrobiia bacterium]
MSDDTPSPRLNEFQREVDELRITGGRANPERLAVTVSIVLFLAAVVIEIIAFLQSSNADDLRDQTDMVILALLGVVVAMGAVAMFLRASLTRWFRYWLVRLIYENRASTDRTVEALNED